jgi:hypothetical protein
MREKFTDLSLSHISGMAFLVKKDEAFDPRDICSFSVQGIMLHADDITHLFQ